MAESQTVSRVDIGPGPRSTTDLFLSFTWLALQGFGGVIAVVQRELVERKRWITNAEFLEEWAVAQTLPGPNVVNLALMIGARTFGLAGALAAVGGLVLVPLLLVLVLAALYSANAELPLVRGAIRGMGAVAAGLIFGSALRLMGAMRGSVLGSAACWVAGSATFLLTGLLRLPLAYTLLIVGPAAAGWAYVQIARRAAPSETA